MGRAATQGTAAVTHHVRPKIQGIFSLKNSSVKSPSTTSAMAGAPAGGGSGRPSPSPTSFDLQAREFSSNADKVDMALEFMAQNVRSLDGWLALRAGAASTSGSSSSSTSTSSTAPPTAPRGSSQGSVAGSSARVAAGAGSARTAAPSQGEGTEAPPRKNCRRLRSPFATDRLPSGNCCTAHPPCGSHSPNHTHYLC